MSFCRGYVVGYAAAAGQAMDQRATSSWTGTINRHLLDDALRSFPWLSRYPAGDASCPDSLTIWRTGNYLLLQLRQKVLLISNRARVGVLVDLGSFSRTGRPALSDFVLRP